VPCRLPDFDDDRPQVVLANPIVYRNDTLPEDLHATLPYYFDGPEKYVSEKVVPGFGPSDTVRESRDRNGRIRHRFRVS